MTTYPELKPINIYFNFSVDRAEVLADTIALHNQPESPKLRAVRVRHTGGNTIIITETGYKTSSVANIVGTLENIKGTGDRWEVLVPDLETEPNTDFMRNVYLAVSSLQEGN